MKQGGESCAAFNCSNRRNNCKLSFFRFPKDKERYVHIDTQKTMMKFPYIEFDLSRVNTLLKNTHVIKLFLLNIIMSFVRKCFIHLIH